MDNKNLLKILNDITPDSESTDERRILIIDGLNLFFRNFAMLNAVTSSGTHVGGLGGFFRSLGFLIRQMQPSEVYVVFDGIGSAGNRKNIIPEYKSGRNSQRITNWEVFENLDEESHSKIDQIVRIVQYLKTLPLKVLALDKVEADDIIAYLSEKFSKEECKTFIVSSDNDFIQLVKDNVILYRPVEKEYYTPRKVKEKFGVPPENFILYKTLLGDNSDKIQGIRGLGGKGITKKFPELTESKLGMSDLFNLSESKFLSTKNIIYAKIIQEFERLEKNYKVMNLSKPMIDESDEEYINNMINSKELNFLPTQFCMMYHEDELGGMIRNVESWVGEIFGSLVTNKI
jgi:5'-3' exonuclease